MKEIDIDVEIEKAYLTKRASFEQFIYNMQTFSDIIDMDFGYVLPTATTNIKILSQKNDEKNPPQLFEEERRR